MSETVPVTTPFPSSPVIGSEPKLPGLVGIWVGIASIVAGIVLGIVLVVNGVTSFVDGLDGLQRVPVPDGGVVEVEDAGRISVYAERSAPGADAGVFTSSAAAAPPGISVVITGPTGEEVPFEPGTDTLSYTFSGRSGQLIGRFDAAAPGIYAVRPVTVDGAQPFESVAVGEVLDIDESGIVAILGGVFGGGLLVLIGIVLVIVSAVRRSRAKKQRNLAMAPFGGPAGGAAPGGWRPPPPPPAGAAPVGFGGPPTYGAEATQVPPGWPPPAPSTDLHPPVSPPGWAPPPPPSGPEWSPGPAEGGELFDPHPPTPDPGPHQGPIS